MVKVQIKHGYTDAVLFECEVPDEIENGLRVRHAFEKAASLGADLSGSYLVGADLSNSYLSGTNLSDADLSPIKTDFFDVLLRAPREVTALRAALLAGHVDGSTYEGECACLVGTIANARHVNHRQLGAGLKPDSSRPAERFFLAIRKGDTPATNGAAKIAVDWIDEFAGLMAAPREAA